MYSRGLLKQVNLNSKGGTVTVDGVEKTVEINEDVPATFDDETTARQLMVLVHTVTADGTVTFILKSFHR